MKIVKSPKDSLTLPHSQAANIIASGRSVIKQELQGLEALLNSLDDSFIDAVNIISNLQGKLIFSGIGKSGHIAHKISSSFSSTGTPSVFLHPSEASHGDLGIIDHQDIVVLLSNSGETRELHDILYYAIRNHIKIISIIRNKDSTLAKASSLALVIPDIAEASIEVAAPTTSALMMLAMGDALVIATMTNKGFSSEHYKLLHPGGKLGSSLLKVEDLMHSDIELPIAPLGLSMSEVINIMTAKTLGCIAIIDDNGYLKGVITDGDLRRNIKNDILNKTAAEIMNTNPKCVFPYDIALQAMKDMELYRITNLFVVDEMRKPLGVIHIKDCLRAGL